MLSFLLSVCPPSQFDAPLFVTWYQCLVTVAICWLLGRLRFVHPYFLKYPVFEYKPTVARQVGGIVFAEWREVGVNYDYTHTAGPTKELISPP